MLIKHKIIAVIALLTLIGTGSIYSRKPQISRQDKLSRPSQTTADTATYTAEVHDLMQRAKAGDAAAQNLLGMRYLTGNGIQQNDSLGYNWISMAAIKKNPQAIANLAYCVRHGRGIAPDSLKAIQLYCSAIALGKDPVLRKISPKANTDPFIARTLAYAYANGKGVKRNTTIAKSYLRQAVELGDISALYPYAEACLATKEHVEAMSAYKRAMENGDERANYWYGRYLITGEGGISDPKQGFEIVLPYAQNGMTGAMRLIGDCYANGYGVNKSAPTALQWYTRASEAGNPAASWSAALSYLNNDSITPNFFKALYYMERAAARSSEYRFKQWLDPKYDNSAKYPAYFTFLKSIAAAQDGNTTDMLKYANDLKKKTKNNEGKILEALAQIMAATDAKIIKKGYNTLKKYNSDPFVKYILATQSLKGRLDGYNINVPLLLEQAGEEGLPIATSLLGDLYLYGKCGIQANDPHAMALYLKALEKDGLLHESAMNMANIYENGYAGIKPDKKKAEKIRSISRGDFLPIMLKFLND